MLAIAIATGGCGRSLLGDTLGGTAANDASAIADAGLAPSGCGKVLPADQSVTVAGTAKGYRQYTVMGTGATLAGVVPQNAGPVTFWVRVPADYDPNHAYRVVYVGGHCGIMDNANHSTYELYSEAQGGSEEAIYVAVDDPAATRATSCYDAGAGASSLWWEAFQLIHAVVDQSYCVDNDQVFATGNSGGGMVASLWGCYFAGDGAHPWNGVPGGGGVSTPRQFAPRYHVRGQAVVAADDPNNEPPCNGPVAALLVTQPTAGTGEQPNPRALARVLKMNGCDVATNPTAPWHPEIPTLATCVKYTTCPRAYPVVTCSTDSNKVDHHELAIAGIKRLFDEATATP